MSTQNQTLIDGLSSDLKLTHMVALGTGLGGFGLSVLEFIKSTFLTTAADPSVQIAAIGGMMVSIAVYLAANASLGGAYVNAVANLSGVSVNAGPTQTVPVTQTPGQQTTGQVTQEQVAALVDTLNAIKAKVGA